MGHDCGQLVGPAARQVGDRRRLEKRAGEAEGRREPSAAVVVEHRADVDGQRIGGHHRPAHRTRQAGRIGRRQQVADRLVAACDVPQIVEADRRQRPLREFRARPEPQQPKADATVGGVDALFLRRLHRMLDINAGIDADRCDSGEPANRARQVGTHRVGPGGQHLFVPAVAFNQQGHRCLVDDAVGMLPGPDGPGQRRHQGIVHRAAESCRHPGQNCFSDIRGHIFDNGLHRVLPIAATIQFHPEIGDPRAGQPVVELTAAVGGPFGLGHRPGPHRRRLGTQRIRLTGTVLSPCGEEVLDHRAPGHRIDNEVMNDENDSRGALGIADEHGLDVSPHTGSQPRGGRFEGTHQIGVELVVADPVCRGQLGHPTASHTGSQLPVAVGLSQGGTEHRVRRHHGLDDLAQRRAGQLGRGHQHHRLREVRKIVGGVTQVQHPRHHRCQRNPIAITLVGLHQVGQLRRGVRRHLRDRPNRLVLEDLSG